MAIFNRGTRLQLLAAVAIGAMAIAAPALAQEQPKQEYNLEAQDLGQALVAVSRQSGRDINFPSAAVQGKRAPRLKGTFTVEEAVRALLADSDLVADFSGDAVIIRGREAPSSEIADHSAGNSDIVVTGSRIHGVPSASPVIIISQRQMIDAGQNSLADVARSIPQNFNGGQNPGIGLTVPSSSGSNLGASTGLNLRGIGGDATLTLLNGHRLAYNASQQSVDISSIPFAAVDRIEVVADGASAIYGSDAVAGVANIILKRDYDGLSTSARFGASTDGGNAQQQYSVVGGKIWASGGFIAAAEIEQTTPILARERSYAAGTAPGLTLYPELKRHGFMFSGHQSITGNLQVEWDSIYNRRKSHYEYALDTRGDYLASGGQNFSDSESFVIAPSLKWAASGAWSFSFAGMYGQDHALYGAANYFGGVDVGPIRGCYCNKAQSLEANANGTLFSLPGGTAKIALGGGFRSNDFHAFRAVGAAQNINVSQDAYFAFGEISLPLIGPDQSLPFANRLTANAALRYENYPGVGEVATPKIGIVYAPSPDFELKGSWGKSFRAPTLFLQYNINTVSLFTAASRGGSGYPTAATVLLLGGGNPNLKPERATTWTVTFAAHPRFLEGVRLEVSYFNIKYRDRIASPITFVSQALSNPIYADLVNFSPTDAQKAAAIANGGAFSNAVGRVYDPADVVAIINNTNLNVARQDVQGVDISAEYKIDLARYGTLTLSGVGSYLESSRQLSSLQPVVSLAGYVFNPPHYRARGGVTWNTDALTMTSYVNYTGSVEDVRTAPGTGLHAMTTFDLTARYKIQKGPGPFRNIDLVLSVQNMFNDQPALLKGTQVYEHPFDSTNYSPTGRFVSFGITKRW